MKPPSEADIVHACVDYLRYRGYLVWRASTGAARYPNADGTHRLMRFGPVGQPDIFAVIPHAGRLLAVECKQPGRHATPAQADFLGRINRAGGLGIVVHSLNELIEALARAEV